MSQPTASCVACARCGLFMKAVTTGQVVEELDSRGEAYRVWSCDEFECGGCGARVVMRFAREPLAEHYQPEEYARAKRRARYQLR